ncbi:MBL fold metallo-hydrolase [Nocardia sp. BMG111209]|uniref:MBL fold metallo-hydrolase n=1 Tax=Nocardia sp. BMG111209 TaxID=1160137 RepID=UPI00056880E3|nr:MBL fold metallo-hydrolase [Nocardia sp. BMG111209]
MRIHHLNCGSTEPLGGKLMGGAGHPLRKAHGICHCLLLETENALVLVDTGLGMKDIENPVERLGKSFVRLARPVLDPEQTALQQIRGLGYDPRDLTHIVLTHLDPDHAGGLSDFPQARVHLLAEEHRAATSGGGPKNSSRVNHRQWAHGPRWETYSASAGDRWFGFDAVRELRGLPPEILLIPLPGHTYGHSGVAVRLDSLSGTAEKWLLHAGDAYFVHTELDRDHPRAPMGVAAFERKQAVDAAARETNQARLRALVNSHSDRVELISAHDPAELARYGAVTATSPR